MRCSELTCHAVINYFIARDPLGNSLQKKSYVFALPKAARSWISRSKNVVTSNGCQTWNPRGRLISVVLYRILGCLVQNLTIRDGAGSQIGTWPLAKLAENLWRDIAVNLV